MHNSDNSKLTFKGSPVKVRGASLRTGEKLPEFTLTGAGLKDLTNADFTGKVLVISVIPSIDTPVCALQTKSFNRAASELSKDVAILTVSVDLPFAQSRWCGQEGIENITMASDFKYQSFAKNFGVLMPDLGLLCRAVFITDKTGNIKHVEYVSEVTEEPDYNAAMSVIRPLM